MKIRSIKRFLIITISSSLLITGLITIAWTYNTIKDRTGKFFDLLLVENSDTLKAFFTSDLTQTRIDKIQKNLIKDNNLYRLDLKHLSEVRIIQQNEETHIWSDDLAEEYRAESIFQVWRLREPKLLLYSKFAKNLNLNTKQIRQNIINTGFSDEYKDIHKVFDNIVINGKIWRVCTKYSRKYDLIVQTAQMMEMREYLANIIIKEHMYPLLAFSIILFVLIILFIEIAIANINKLVSAISKRDPKNLSLLNIEKPVKEILPLIGQINKLFTLITENFKRESRFSSDAAHELKTPLAGIKAQAEVISKNLIKNKQQNNIENLENLEKIIHVIDRADHIVSQLLILSRLSPDKPLENITCCHLDKISRIIIADLINKALDKNIEISLNIKLLNKNKDISLEANQALIEILLRNLIDNAIKYSNKNNTIDININDYKDKIILKVIDTGPGLSNEQKKRVLDRFYRVSETSTQVEGSGLGLSIVKLICDMHNADLQILDNTKAGHGLVVKIIFKK